MCELEGSPRDGVALGVLAGSPSFARVAGGQMSLSLGAEGAAFVEIRLPTATVLRGFAWQGDETKTAALLYARHWLAFGGVYYPSASTPLRIQAVKDGKFVVTPVMGDTAVALDDGARTLEVSCADLSLTQDADGVLRTQAPAAFLASGKDRFLWLSGNTPVPISAAESSPASASLALADGKPIKVVELERRGQRARVRYQHVAGWVDAARLSAKEPKSSPQPATNKRYGVPPAKNEATPRGGRVSCKKEVRLVAELASSRYLVGAIPGGQSFVISESPADLAYVSSEGSGVTMMDGARLAVPARDAAECTESKGDSADALGKWDAVLEGASGEVVAEDAVSALPADPPPPIPATNKNGTPWGPRTVPRVKSGAMTVSGKLPPEVVKRIVRQNFGRIRLCYEQGLLRNPTLAGQITAKFVIGRDGSVPTAANGGSSLNDASVVNCVVRVFSGLTFPQPESGIVVVTFPIELSTN